MFDKIEAKVYATSTTHAQNKLQRRQKHKVAKGAVFGESVASQVT